MQDDGSTQRAVVRIPLWGRGGVIKAYALVDAEDAERVERWRWWQHHRRGYAVRTINHNANGVKSSTKVMLHREILGLPHKKDSVGLEGDHINKDVLDNRRSNLRAVIPIENLRNRTYARAGGPTVREKRAEARGATFCVACKGLGWFAPVDL